MTTITLTSDQQNALEAFSKFLCDPTETVFLLSGYSGTGKSTLVKTLLDQLPDFMKAVKLINPQARNYQVELTATTNKAAEVFSQLTGQPVATIHSFLGLRVSTNYETGVTHLIPRSLNPKEGILLFIDEASYIDSPLLSWIFKLTTACKIIFMGDPAQLTPVKASGTPVFDAKFTGAQLTQVVRQAAGNPIVTLSTKFRETVNTGEFFSFIPDGQAIKHLPREDFNKAIETEFTRADWKYADSKILAWTNKCTIGYNHAVQDHVKGDPRFQVGDYAVCNKFVSINNKSLKTDQLVQITGISSDYKSHGVLGNDYTLDSSIVVFGPKSVAEKDLLIKRSKAIDDFATVALVDNRWVDLRSAYASTINKSQGSTYKKVFIDLDDVKKVNNGNALARMLYVAVSRAKEQVYFTGDLV